MNVELRDFSLHLPLSAPVPALPTVPLEIRMQGRWRCERMREFCGNRSCTVAHRGVVYATGVLR